MPMVIRTVVTKSDAVMGLAAPGQVKSSEEMLQACVVGSLADSIHELGQIAAYAAEVFDGLLSTTTDMFSRTVALGHRIDKIETQLPQMQEQAERNEFSFAVERDDWRNKLKPDQTQILTVGSRMAPIARVYTGVSPNPPMKQLDSFREDGMPCMKLYSYPQFFQEEWIRLRQKEASERDNRRKKKKKLQVRPSIAERPRANVRVKEVAVKKYDSHGNVVAEEKSGGGGGGATARPAGPPPPRPGNAAAKLGAPPPPPPGGKRPQGKPQAAPPPPPPGAKAIAKPGQPPPPAPSTTTNNTNAVAAAAAASAPSSSLPSSAPPAAPPSSSAPPAPTHSKKASIVPAEATPSPPPPPPPMDDLIPPPPPPPEEEEFDLGIGTDTFDQSVAAANVAADAGAPPAPPPPMDEYSGVLEGMELPPPPPSDPPPPLVFNAPSSGADGAASARPKSSMVAAKPVVDPRNNLLDQIRAGRTLRKVENDDEGGDTIGGLKRDSSALSGGVRRNPSSASRAGAPPRMDFQSELTSILARRMAMEVSESESSSDEEDNEDWD